MSPGTPASREKAVRTVSLVKVLPLVKQGPADPKIPTRLTHVPNSGHINHGVKPSLVYTISEGHNSPPFCFDNKKDKRNDPLLLSKNKDQNKLTCKH
jgi:hypothetical protein